MEITVIEGKNLSVNPRDLETIRLDLLRIKKHIARADEWIDTLFGLIHDIEVTQEDEYEEEEPEKEE